jgi:hypothetical protein
LLILNLNGIGVHKISRNQSTLRSRIGDVTLSDGGNGLDMNRCIFRLNIRSWAWGHRWDFDVVFDIEIGR